MATLECCARMRRRLDASAALAGFDIVSEGGVDRAFAVSGSGLYEIDRANGAAHPNRLGGRTMVDGGNGVTGSAATCSAATCSSITSLAGVRHRMAATPLDPAVAQVQADAELLAALTVDPSNALGALYDRYAGLVYGLAMKILGAPSEAEDLTQEIFLMLCAKCDYDPARGSLSAFLVTVTRSRAIDRIRARTRKTRFLEHWGEVIPAEAGASPLEKVSIAECSERVRAALADLPESQRRVLEMAYYRGLSQSEIADELETPLGTVKSWARRGLSSLRESLAPLAG